MSRKNHYKTLGLAPTAHAADIKKAYRKLARKHHPDISKAPDANARMAALNEAHDVLSDPEKRQAYDNPVSEAPAYAGRDFRSSRQGADGFAFNPGGRGGGPPDPSQSAFFEQLFERAARGARAPAALRGDDHTAHIELELSDAYDGAERSLTVKGQAGVDVAGADQHLQVRIPRGVHAGQQIRLAGRGGPGEGGAPAGDLLLEVRFKPDPRWRTEGRDVYQRLALAPWEAALGTPLHIHTPGGAAEVNVPAGWKAGRKLRLKERGIPGAAGQAAGHLYLELELALPAADTEAARAAYAALAAAFPAFQPRPTAGA